MRLDAAVLVAGQVAAAVGPVVVVVSAGEGRPVIGKKEILSPDQIKKITQAVIKAEAGTSGEIVPMIVNRSSAIGHLPFYVALILFSLSAVALFELKSNWLHLWWGLPIGLLFLGCLVGGFVLSQFHSIQRWLIPAIDEETQVWNRAYSEWAVSHVRKTKARTGILLFVSVMEKKAVVLADEGIAKHYSQETWQKVIDILSQHLRKGEWTEGFERSIQLCGDILKTHLPADTENINEISDRIIIKD